MAYEVQKALSDPTLKYRTKLEEDLKEQEAEIRTLHDKRDMEKNKHELEVERIKTEHKVQFEDLNRKILQMTEKSQEYQAEVQRLLKKHKTAWNLLLTFGSFVVLALLLKACWWYIDSLSESIKAPILCKVSVSVAAITALVGIISRKKWWSVILFVLTALGVLFSAWTLFVG